MSQFAREDRRGAIDLVSDGDITFESDRDQDGEGDLVFRTGGVERARIAHDGTSTFGGSQPAWEQQPVLGWGKGGTVTPGKNKLMFLPIPLLRPATLNSLGITRVSAGGDAGSVARLGIYTGAAGTPDTLILDAGLVDVTTLLDKNISGLDVALPAGLYWLAMVEQGGTVAATYDGTGTQNTMRPWIGQQNANDGDFDWWVGATEISGPLPTTLPLNSDRGPVPLLKMGVKF